MPSTRTLAVVALVVTVAAVAPVAGTAAAADESPTFEHSTVTVDGGETAEIRIAFPEGTESARVTVGSEATNFVVGAAVVDADGDGEAVLELDTGTAGTTDAASYLSVSDGDELREAEQETDRLRSPLDPADYDLRLGPVDDPDADGSLVIAGASATPAANVTNTETGVDGDAPTFVDAIVTADSGETAEIPVALPSGNESARVTVGSEDAGFVARATVVDGDGDAVLELDTGAAGTTDAASYLTVADGDELREAEQETDELPSGLAPSDYDLRIGPADDATAVGTLVVTAASTPPETAADSTASGSDASSALGDATVTVDGGSVARIPITFPEGTESARVTVGSEATNFVVGAAVVDGDGDGDAVLELDTGAAGTTDAASYLSVSDGDELREAEQETDRLPSSLDPGNYDVRIGPADAAVDVGALVIRDASTPTRAATTESGVAATTVASTATESTPGGTQTASPGFGVLVGALALLTVGVLAGRR